MGNDEAVLETLPEDAAESDTVSGGDSVQDGSCSSAPDTETVSGGDASGDSSGDSTSQIEQILSEESGTGMESAQVEAYLETIAASHAVIEEQNGIIISILLIFAVVGMLKLVYKFLRWFF